MLYVMTKAGVNYDCIKNHDYLDHEECATRDVSLETLCRMEMNQSTYMSNNLSIRVSKLNQRANYLLVADFVNKMIRVLC